MLSVAQFNWFWRFDVFNCDEFCLVMLAGWLAGPTGDGFFDAITCGYKMHYRRMSLVSIWIWKGCLHLGWRQEVYCIPEEGGSVAEGICLSRHLPKTTVTKALKEQYWYICNYLILDRIILIVFSFFLPIGNYSHWFIIRYLTVLFSDLFSCSITLPPTYTFLKCFFFVCHVLQHPLHAVH